VELIIALAVMVVALLSLMVAITSASRINDNSRERTIAYELAKSKIEEMRNFTRCGSFDRIFYFYSQNSNANVFVGDPTLPDPLQLNPISLGGVTQPIITISFPVDGAGLLTESPTGTAGAVFAAKFGMPKDLNRNGTTTDSGAVLYDAGGGSPPPTAYTILPVIVTVQWESTGKKPAMVDLATLITVK
jgi:type II secretory pathway pseudopilin PulG